MLNQVIYCSNATIFYRTKNKKISFVRKYMKQLLGTGLVADTVTKTNDKIWNLMKNVEEIIIPPEKRNEILDKMRKAL